MVIVVIFGILALACIGGGVFAIVAKANAKTELQLWGAQVKTGHVGVAFVALGMLIALFTVKAVLKNQRDLARLPIDEVGRGR